jgi:hypothetical protein
MTSRFSSHAIVVSKCARNSARIYVYSVMRFTCLFSVLLAAALCNSACSQDLPSSCSDCTALNPDNVYDLGRPSAVWCSSDPPRPSPIRSSGGTCLLTTSLIQPPFTYPNGSIQCSALNINTMTPPCAATAPYASFASCECSNSCFAGTKKEPAYLVRSCASCVARGYSWIAQDDLNSLSCMRYDDDKETDSCSDAEDKEKGKKCIRKAAYSGFPYCTPQAAADKRYGPPSFDSQVYTTPFECAQGVSFCASIRIGRGDCIAMIVLLSNTFMSLIIMCWSRKFAKVAMVERSPNSDSNEENRTGWLFDMTEVACCFYADCRIKEYHRACNIFCEFCATFLCAPMMLFTAFYWLAGLIFINLCRILVVVAQGLRTLCRCKAALPASDANFTGVPQITAVPAPAAADPIEEVRFEDPGDRL